MPCTVGGIAPGANPCETIHLGLLDCWRVDEGSGGVAASIGGIAAMQLTAWDGDEDRAWTPALTADGNRKFFCGIGTIDLEPEFALLKTVGSAMTIVQRRWHLAPAAAIAPVPPEFTAFGQGTFAYFDVSDGPSTVKRPPFIVAQPRLGSVQPSGQRLVTPGPFYVQRANGGLEAIAGTACPAPALWPPSGIVVLPYVVAITAVVDSPGQVTFSVMGHDGTRAMLVACQETDGDAGDATVTPPPPPPPPPPPGKENVTLRPMVIPGVRYDNVPTSSLLSGPLPSLYAANPSGGLTRIVIGGKRVAGSFLDGFGEVAVYNRALSVGEVAFIGGNLSKVFASFVEPLSACSVTVCTEPGGLGTVNPLINADGSNALRWSRCTLTYRTATIAGGGSNLREARTLHENKVRRYTLEWDRAGKEDVQRVAEALAATRNGCLPTKWRHPTDDNPAPPGTVCDAKRWLIVSVSLAGRDVTQAAAEVSRAAVGGKVAQMAMVLEEV